MLHCAFLINLTDGVKLEQLSRWGLEIDVIGKSCGAG